MTVLGDEDTVWAGTARLRTAFYLLTGLFRLALLEPPATPETSAWFREESDGSVPVLVRVLRSILENSRAIVLMAAS
jgi:hypothetical protein